MSGGTPATSNPEYWDGTINWYTPAEISEARYVYGSQKKITEVGLNNSSAKILPKDRTILFTSRAGIGKTAILKNDASTNQGFQSIVVKNNIDPEFVYSMSTQIKEKAERVAAGSTFSEISGKQLGKIILMIPGIKEQQRIGELFSIIDNLITLHQRKSVTIKKLKSGLLRKMILTVESTLTDVFLPLFTIDWEQRKFKDLVFKSGKKNKKNLPYESFSITNESGFVSQNEQFENGGTMKDADKSMYIIVSPNSFAYNPARINVGSIGYQALGKNVIVSSLYEVFKTSHEVDDHFLWYWFKSDHFKRLVESLQEGGVRLYFYFDKLQKGELWLPPIEEQRKIGGYFKSVDNLITLHQRKLFIIAYIK